MLDLFKQFLADKTASTLYITGVAGTGKTTSLAELIQHCQSVQLNTVTCAFTHRAVLVLATKIPVTKDNVVCTLHSYLKKRPSINGNATKVTKLDSNIQVSLPETIDVLFVDEFSMIGDRDYESINTLQYNDDGGIRTKVVYIGDPNQLPPVKDEFSIIPKEPYWIKLTTIHRQESSNPLIGTLIDLNDYIDGKSVTELKPHSNFIRKQDIAKLYKADNKSKILLAYTNKKVQELNVLVHGRSKPIIEDWLFSPTIRKEYMLENINYGRVDSVIAINGDIIEPGSKYKTLETLQAMDGIEFYDVADEDFNGCTRAVVFGHDNYLQHQAKLGKAATKVNRDIESKFNTQPSHWAKSNWSHPLAKERAKVWKDYLSFKANVICLDFTHAMTIHKSQGSTYENVYLDMEDIAKCADKDYKLYLKLLYVAISRASNTVFTN